MIKFVVYYNLIELLDSNIEKLIVNDRSNCLQIGCVSQSTG